ncbi:MAG TPA: hypothetical protein VIM07_00315 [Chitinophagaceae bacterium]
MEIRDSYMQAILVKFFAPTRETEPPVIGIVFEDWAMAVANYEILVQNFKNHDLHIHFKHILETEIEMDFLRNTNGEWVTGTKVGYDKKEFEDFISVVNESRSYVVAFGHLDEDMFVADNIPGAIEPVLITFKGYTK